MQSDTSTISLSLDNRRHSAAYEFTEYSIHFQIESLVVLDSQQRREFPGKGFASAQLLNPIPFPSSHQEAISHPFSNPLRETLNLSLSHLVLVLSIRGSC